LALCLLLDFLQQVVGSEIYRLYGSYKEHKVKEGEKFLQPYWLLWPMDIFYWVKFIALFAGFSFITHYLWLNFA